jgi:hypothetical protein
LHDFVDAKFKLGDLVVVWEGRSREVPPYPDLIHCEPSKASAMLVRISGQASG